MIELHIFWGIRYTIIIIIIIVIIIIIIIELCFSVFYFQFFNYTPLLHSPKAAGHSQCRSTVAMVRGTSCSWIHSDWPSQS